MSKKKINKKISLADYKTSKEIIAPKEEVIPITLSTIQSTTAQSSSLFKRGSLSVQSFSPHVQKSFDVDPDTFSRRSSFTDQEIPQFKNNEIEEDNISFGRKTIFEEEDNFVKENNNSFDRKNVLEGGKEEFSFGRKNVFENENVFGEEKKDFSFDRKNVFEEEKKEFSFDMKNVFEEEKNFGFGFKKSDNGGFGRKKVFEEGDKYDGKMKNDDYSFDRKSGGK